MFLLDWTSLQKCAQIQSVNYYEFSLHLIVDLLRSCSCRWIPTAHEVFSNIIKTSLSVRDISQLRSPREEKLYEVVSNKFLTSTFNFSSTTNIQLLHLIQMICVSMSQSQNAQYTKNQTCNISPAEDSSYLLLLCSLSHPSLKRQWEEQCWIWEVIFRMTLTKIILSVCTIILQPVYVQR